jgi:hypothetical protein|tara:strand:+ start:2750 stop:3292 length:543 start_codon:yes stop_codon:yes gene_type:complete
MEIKKGIVKSVQSNGNLKLQHGMFYKFEIEIGEDVGEYLSKSEDGGNKNFPVGQEKEYQLTETSYGKKIKPHFQQKSFTPRQAFGENPDRQKMIVKQSSLKVASDLCIANNNTDLNSVFNMADKIVAWVMDDKPVQHAELRTGIETKSVTRTQAKKDIANEMENFAEQSGQTMHPEDLPF